MHDVEEILTLDEVAVVQALRLEELHGIVDATFSFLLLGWLVLRLRSRLLRRPHGLLGAAPLVRPDHARRRVLPIDSRQLALAGGLGQGWRRRSSLCLLIPRWTHFLPVLLQWHLWRFLLLFHLIHGAKEASLVPLSRRRPAI